MVVYKVTINFNIYNLALAIKLSCKKNPPKIISPQFLSTKLGRIRVFSHAEEAGLKQGDFVVSVNGKEVMLVLRTKTVLTFHHPGVRPGPQGGVRPGHRGRQQHAHGHREVGYTSTNKHKKN